MQFGHILETFAKFRKAKKLVGPLVGLVIGVLLETRPTFSPFEILHKFRECAQIAYFRCITKFIIYPEDDIQLKALFAPKKSRKSCSKGPSVQKKDQSRIVMTD